MLLVHVGGDAVAGLSGWWRSWASVFLFPLFSALALSLMAVVGVGLLLSFTLVIGGGQFLQGGMKLNSNFNFKAQGGGCQFKF